MKNKILALLIFVSISTAQAGKIECTGKTISEDGPKPAKVILSYDSFPGKIHKLTVITDKARSWKMNWCKASEDEDEDCSRQKPINPNREDFVLVVANNAGESGDGNQLGFFLQKEKGVWIGYFWNGSILSVEAEVTVCKIIPKEHI